MCQVKTYTSTILRALDYLHSLKPPVVHRDLKCANIFIDGYVYLAAETQTVD